MRFIVCVFAVCFAFTARVQAQTIGGFKATAIVAEAQLRAARIQATLDAPTQTPEPTPTPQPTSTDVPTLIPTNTPTHMPIETPTPIPTATNAPVQPVVEAQATSKRLAIWPMVAVGVALIVGALIAVKKLKLW